MATNLENKVSDIIGSVIVALKAKGVSNLSVHKIVDYINTRYNVLLDDDVVKDVYHLLLVLLKSTMTRYLLVRLLMMKPMPKMLLIRARKHFQTKPLEVWVVLQ